MARDVDIVVVGAGVVGAATARALAGTFAEVVLLNTLLYRVEQVFLIDRDSGILLQHVKAGTVAVQDADTTYCYMVAAA